jgi:class 3 adenylate cyclase
MAAGEPVDHNDDLFGSTVTLASRICDAADPRQTLVSDLVNEMGIERGFAMHGPQARQLKGYGASTQIFELLRTPNAPV